MSSCGDHARCCPYNRYTGYQYFFVDGTYREGLIERWLKGTVPGNYTALIAEVKTHEPPGPWYDAVNGSMWVSKVHWPAVHFGGWFDIFRQYR